MKNRLLTVGNKFRSKYFLTNGNSFYGQVLEIPDTSRVSNFLSARRYLRTEPNTIVKPRDVVIIDGLKYIVADHGTGFFVTPIYKHFKLFLVDLELKWYTKQIVIHPVTGVKTFDRTLSNGIAYISSQPRSSIEDGLKIQTPQKLFLTNQPVAVDDILGDFIDGDLNSSDFDPQDFSIDGKFVGSYVVTKSDQVLGITDLEVKVL